MVDAAPVAGNLVKLRKAKYISLVGQPANQIGIKVLRSDEQGDTKVNHPIVRRTKRSETSPVLRLTFPEGTDESAVQEALKNYGMVGYTVSNEAGTFTATRGDLKSISTDGTMDIKLSDDGLIATVARQETGLATGGDKPAIALVRVEFDASKYTLEDVQRWATEKCVDGAVEEPQNPGQCYVVRRSAVPEAEETRRMVLENGVEAVVVRSETYDVPAGFAAVVSETAYGNWGWGQLDFAAALADEAFSDSMRHSIRTLEEVLRNIVIYSALPLDVRKDLAVRALGQFGEYVSSVMDSLPRQLLVAVVRSANPQPEKKVTQATQSGSTTPAAAPEDKALTRAEAKTMIDEAVAAAVAALKPADTTRSEPAAEPTKVEEPAKAPEVLTRADISAVLADALKPVADRLTVIEGQTVVRSAATDPVVKPAEPKNKDDVFRGALGLGRKQAAA